MSEHLDGLPYLNVLRPDPGWTVEVALLATYSVELVALGSTVLALAGLDDERGSGSPVDFAHAFEEVRDKLVVLVQKGRVAAPSPTKRTNELLALLDRFIVEVPFEETTRSWHPKLALVKFRAIASDDVCWRLWIGSRNLTQSRDWDLGLTLVSSTGGQPVPGIAALGKELAECVLKHGHMDGLDPAALQTELAGLRWQAPSGVVVEDVSLFVNRKDKQPPRAPRGLRSLDIVSPFIDQTFTGKLAGWCGKRCRRRLVTTLNAALELAANNPALFDKFDEVLYLHALFEEDATPVEEGDSEEADPDFLGLHAKLILANHGDEHTLWMGSANATSRAWFGANAEAVARLKLDATHAEGFSNFIAHARPLRREDLREPDAEDLDDVALDAAHKQLCARWDVRQELRAGLPVLINSQSSPHPEDPQVTLSVGLLSRRGWTDWARGHSEQALPSVEPAAVTELVRVRLCRGSRTRTCVLRAPLPEPPDVERDRRALMRQLNLGAFMSWLGALLETESAPGTTGEWHQPRTNSSPGRAGATMSWMPALESILRSWSRRPKSLIPVDHRVRNYLRLFMETSPDLSQEEREALAGFESTWQLVREALLEERT